MKRTFSEIAVKIAKNTGDKSYSMGRECRRWHIADSENTPDFLRNFSGSII